MNLSGVQRLRWPTVSVWSLSVLTLGFTGCNEPNSGNAGQAPLHQAPSSQSPAQSSGAAGDQAYGWTNVSSLATLALSPGSNSLSAQTWTAASNGWGPVEIDRSVNGNQGGDGNVLTLGGKTYVRGFGVHATSSMTFNLAAQCKNFTADVGVDDEVGSRGSVVFQVLGDGSKLFDSGSMTGTSVTQTLNVPVAGVKELKLLVSDGGNGNTNDHADWAEPTLLNCAAVPPSVPLRIRTGGPAQTVDGVAWTGCSSLTACNGYVTGGFPYGEARAISGAVSPANQALYQTEWTGGSTNGVPVGQTAFEFKVPLPNGRYTLRLHFAELNKSAVGARVFDVSVEGAPVLSNFDVFKEAGGAQKAVVRALDTTVSDGVLNIAFVRRVENAKVSGIEILPAAAAGPVVWTERAPALLAVSEAQGAAVGGALYVFGGFNKDLHTTARSQVYDLATNLWATAPDMPEQITHGAVAVDGGVIYIAGGFVGTHPGPQTNHVWKFDTVSRSWSAGPPLPSARGAGALVRLGRALHFFGGTERDVSNLDLYKRDSPEHWVLNLDGGTTWSVAAPMPNARNHLAGAVVNGLIYAIGGQHLGDEDAGVQSEMDRYDPATDRWTAVAPMPRPAGHINSSTLVWNGRIVVISGVTLKSLEIANVTEYDPASNVWTDLTPIPAARQSPIADLLGTQVVVTTGSLPAGVFGTTWVGAH